MAIQHADRPTATEFIINIRLHHYRPPKRRAFQFAQNRRRRRQQQQQQKQQQQQQQQQRNKQTQNVGAIISTPYVYRPTVPTEHLT